MSRICCFLAGANVSLYFTGRDWENLAVGIMCLVASFLSERYYGTRSQS